MYDVRLFRPPNKETATLVIIAVVLLVAVFFAGYLLGLGTYQITEEELTQLETNLRKLEQLSSTQKTELTRLQEQLTKSEQELALLKSQLATSSTQLTQAQNSLQTANELLKQYADEEKNKRLKIKAQRNTYFIMMVAATAFAVCHR